MYKNSIILVLLLATAPVWVNAQVKYRHPLSSSTYVSYWYDHDSTSGKFKKYTCSTSGGYDTHKGSDFPASLGSSIYSGAAGELYYRKDGCKSTPDPLCGSGFGNHVRIKHTDGRVSIYAHMKNGTPAWQQSTLCSAKIGEVACSGRCDGNHVHFELWSNTSAGSRIDPFAGSCSQTTSYWVSLNTSNLPKTSCQPTIYPLP